jgi:hypothetical protein
MVTTNLVLEAAAGVAVVAAAQGAGFVLLAERAITGEAGALLADFDLEAGGRRGRAVKSDEGLSNT